jgi:hypothetical protein
MRQYKINVRQQGSLVSLSHPEQKKKKKKKKYITSDVREGGCGIQYTVYIYFFTVASGKQIPVSCRVTNETRKYPCMYVCVCVCE